MVGCTFMENSKAKLMLMIKARQCRASMKQTVISKCFNMCGIPVDKGVKRFNQEKTMITMTSGVTLV